MSGPAESRGRTRITARAIERVAAAVTAEAFGSPGDRVRIALTDQDGGLDIAATTGIGTPSLTRAMDEPRSITRLGGSVLERAGRAEETVRTRVAELTGSAVRSVEIHLTSVHVHEQRRVR